jgi:hypothetical protein
MKHKLLMYSIRWQLSTPVLAICIWLLPYNIFWKTVISNLIGSLIFFKVDQYIMKEGKL